MCLERFQWNRTLNGKQNVLSASAQKMPGRKVLINRQPAIGVTEPAKCEHARPSDIRHMARGYAVDDTSFKGRHSPKEQTWNGEVS